MPAGLRGKHHFKHTVAYNEGLVPKPPDDFVAHRPLFAVSLPDSPLPSSQIISVYFLPHLTVTNTFCMVRISVSACLASCCSFPISLLSDAKQHLTWRQFYRREVLKKHLLCGGTDINLLAWNTLYTYTYRFGFPPHFLLPFFFKFLRLTYFIFFQCIFPVLKLCFF